MKIAAYNLLEKILGRSLVWRIGRFLYQGARRELSLDAATDGEYNLQSWLISECAGRQSGSLIVFDVGAFLGWWSKNLTDFVSADGRLQLQLTCFEPAPNQRSELQKRVGPVDREKVKLEINNIALSDYEGEAKFNITGPKTGTSHLLVDNGASDEATGDIITVQVTTADRFMEQNGIEKIDFMKIDTEGNDFRVIMGAERALQRQAIGLIQFEYSGEWVDHGHSIKSVMKFAAAYNYRVGRLTQNYIEQYDNWHLELDRFFLGNYVLLSPQVCLPADRVRKYTMDKYGTAQEVRN